MFRAVCMAFALVVAAVTATIITSAAQSASESFRANLHNGSGYTR
jgi:hypothetical protein